MMQAELRRIVIVSIVFHGYLGVRLLDRSFTSDSSHFGTELHLVKSIKLDGKPALEGSQWQLSLRMLVETVPTLHPAKNFPPKNIGMAVTAVCKMTPNVKTTVTRVRPTR